MSIEDIKSGIVTMRNSVFVSVHTY